MWKQKGTGNNMGDWDHLKITRTVPEQRTGENMKLWNYRKQPYWALQTQTAGSANVKVQNTFHGRNNITCGTNCNYEIATALYIDM